MALPFTGAMANTYEPHGIEQPQEMAFVVMGRYSGEHGAQAGCGSYTYDAIVSR